MIDGSLQHTLAIAAVTGTLGLVLGLGYFAALRRTAALFGSGGHRAEAVALTVGRIAGAAVFLLVAARLGALPLLASFLGFLLARRLALRAVRRAG